MGRVDDAQMMVACHGKLIEVILASRAIESTFLSVHSRPLLACQNTVEVSPVERDFQMARMLDYSDVARYPIFRG